MRVVGGCQQVFWAEGGVRLVLHDQLAAVHLQEDLLKLHTEEEVRHGETVGCHREAEVIRQGRA